MSDPSEPEPALSDLIAARFAAEPSPPEGMPDGDPEFNALPGHETLRAMLSHRSCRKFLPDPVDDRLLELVLAAAFSSPSKSDLQQCSVIIVDDRSKREAIASLIPTMPWIAEAGRFLIFCADSRRIRQVADRAGVEFDNDHLDAVLNAAADAAIHLSSCIWAAEAVGLGTCPISVIRNHIEDVSTLVELPKQVVPIAGLCVGWPERLRRLSPRLPPTVTVHHDRYDDSAAAGLIADYDERRSGGRAVPAEHQLDVDRWGVADRYGWSTEKARMVARRERDGLARFLRSQDLGLD